MVRRLQILLLVRVLLLDVGVDVYILDFAILDIAVQ